MDTVWGSVWPERGYFFISLTKALLGPAMALPGPTQFLWFVFRREGFLRGGSTDCQSGRLPVRAWGGPFPSLSCSFLI